MLLAEAGYDVVMIEEGPHLPLASAPHFSKDEMTQKCRNGGITVGFGKATLAYVEGCCVGGGSEVNRGLYNRTPPEVLATWRRECRVEALQPEQLTQHFDACEQVAAAARVSGRLPTPMKDPARCAESTRCPARDSPRFRAASPKSVLF